MSFSLTLHLLWARLTCVGARRFYTLVVPLEFVEAGAQCAPYRKSARYTEAHPSENHSSENRANVIFSLGCSSPTAHGLPQVLGPSSQMTCISPHVAPPSALRFRTRSMSPVSETGRPSRLAKRKQSPIGRNGD